MIFQEEQIRLDINKENFYNTLINFENASFKDKKIINEKLDIAKMEYDLSFIELKRKEKEYSEN